jgi:hypothetical protein
MLEVDTLVHTEPRAPDGRYAALILVLVAWGMLAVRKRYGRVLSATAPANAGSNRVLGALSSGLLAAWILWLSSSGNSRYFLPMACIASVVLAVVLLRLYERRADFTATAAVLILAMQLTQLILGADLKRDGTLWQGPWLEVRVPERFREEPHVFLSAAYLSGSAFAPYVHPASGFMNITGFYPLGPGHPGGARAQSLIERNLDRVRILIPLPATYVDDASLPNPPEHLTIHVRRFGLRVDPSDCAVMKIAGNLRGALQKRGTTDAAAWTNFATCRLVVAPEEAAAYAREVRIVDAVFDRIEDACPNLFHPRRPVTEQLPMWVRLYNMGSEIQLWMEHGKVQYFSPVARGEPIGIGTVDEWLAGGRRIDCSRKSAPAFGGLLE